MKELLKENFNPRTVIMALIAMFILAGSINVFEGLYYRSSPIEWHVDLQEFTVSDVECGTKHQELTFVRHVKQVYLAHHQWEVFRVREDGGGEFIRHYDSGERPIEPQVNDTLTWSIDSLDLENGAPLPPGQYYWEYTADVTMPNGRHKILQKTSNIFTVGKCNHETLKDFVKKGKRNTYCDHLRHQVIDHGMKIDMTECENKEKTDLQIKLER